MTWIELFFLAVGLSMDAFAVAVSLGLTIAKSNIKKALVIGLYFGIFQAGMPIIGYLAAGWFAGQIQAYGHWIAFGLLTFLGGKMIVGSLKKSESSQVFQETSIMPLKMVPLALATSIDALAVGVSFALLRVNVLPAASIIGVMTFVLSVIGVKVGSICGAKCQSKATLIGGAVLMIMGLWILIDMF